MHWLEDKQELEYFFISELLFKDIKYVFHDSWVYLDTEQSV